MVTKMAMGNDVSIELVNDASPSCAVIAPPETLTIFLGRSDVRGPLVSPAVVAGDEVTAGQPLGTVRQTPIAPSPTSGKVVAVKQFSLQIADQMEWVVVVFKRKDDGGLAPAYSAGAGAGGLALSALVLQNHIFEMSEEAEG